ncbi:MAG: PepSY domain-containing protein [Gaiellaceae bacterium]
MRTTTIQSTSTPAAPPGDPLARVKEIALDELPGGTVVGIETDADGNAYVAHMLNADGMPMTVYVDASFDFVGLS